MPKLFLGNFEFEHWLGRIQRGKTATLDRISAELATSWLSIAQDGDYLCTPQPIDSGFFERGVKLYGMPRVVPVTRLADVPRGTECIPWGWTDHVRRLCEEHGWTGIDPPNAAVTAANSRRLSADLEREWCVGLECATEATSHGEVDRFMDRLADLHGPTPAWLIKAEFGMSGRERIHGSGPMNSSQRQWVTKRLATEGIVFCEPVVIRLGEVGIQIEVPPAGEPQLIDVVPLLADARGQYAGSRFASPGPPLSQVLIEGNWGADVAMRAARRVQDLGYFGPLGIDSMCYLSPEGGIRYRPLQDINARWTMGRLSLGWKRLIRSHEKSGVWFHRSGMENPSSSETEFMDVRDLIKMKNSPIDHPDLKDLLEQFSPRVLSITKGRTIHTSPESVGGAPSRHRSFLEFK